MIGAGSLMTVHNNEFSLSGRHGHRASQIYADLYQQGKIIGDADILIAATAIESDLLLVTNNTAHFSRIKD